MPQGRECHALQKQEHDRGGTAEFELPTFLSRSERWSGQRAQQWEGHAGSMVLGEYSREAVF